MATAGRDGAATDGASDLATALASADAVRLLAAPTADGVAATGLLGRALAARNAAFQARVLVPTAADHAAEPDADEADVDCTVALGTTGVATADHVLADGAGATATATAAVARLGNLDGTATPAPDAALALAGTRSVGATAAVVDERVDAAGLDRRPGVGLPVDDPVDGFAHTTLVHAPCSGDPDATRAALDAVDPSLAEGSLADADDERHRRLASLVAVETTGADDASARSGDAVARALRPTVGGPLATVEGLADVLGTAAPSAPGDALALAVGAVPGDARDAALDAWRTNATAAHDAVRAATTRRYDGCFVARADRAIGPTAARLIADFRSPEPVTLVVGTDAVWCRPSPTPDPEGGTDDEASPSPSPATLVTVLERALAAVDRDATVRRWTDGTVLAPVSVDDRVALADAVRTALDEDREGREDGEDREDRDAPDAGSGANDDGSTEDRSPAPGGDR